MKQRGVFISPDLMGRVSLCMSQTQPDYFFGKCARTRARTCHQKLSMGLIHCAPSMHFVFPRCCHDQDLQPLKLISQTSYLFVSPSHRGGACPDVARNVPTHRCKPQISSKFGASFSKMQLPLLDLVRLCSRNVEKTVLGRVMIRRRLHLSALNWIG